MPFKVLIYAQDTLGLGHVQRCTTIARALLERRPDAAVLLATKSSWPGRLALGPRFDYLKLPSQLTLAAAGAAERDHEREAIRGLRRDILRDAAARLQPDLILVDNEPLGFGGEMEGALDAAPSARAIFGMRDVVDDPARTAESWRALGVLGALRERFDGVLIYGHPDLFDTLETYGVPPDIAARSRYTGYVVAGRPRPDVAQVRTRLGGGGRPLVLVTGGGGQDAAALCEIALDAIDLLVSQPAPRAVIVTGPFMASVDRERIAQRARAGAHLVLEQADVAEAMASVDALVTMGGYNTLAEAMLLGRRPVVVPRATHKREQLMRAEAFDRHGLVHCPPSRPASAAVIARALEAELLEPSRVDARRFLDIDGERAAGLLLEPSSA